MNVDAKVAQNYAEAFFAAAKGQDAVDVILDQIHEVTKAMENVPAAKAFLEAPHVPAGDKMRFAREVLGAKVHPLLGNFIQLLLKKGRILLLADACAAFRTLAERDQGKWHGTVRTATALDDSQRSKLHASLEKSTGRQLVLDYEVDPRVIGGVVFKSGDLLMDNSIATHLTTLRDRLMAVRVH